MVDKKIGLIALVFMVFLGTAPAFAISDSATQPVQVTVSPTVAITAFWNSLGENSTISLGSWPADNLEKTFTGGATGEQLKTYSNVPINVTVLASGNFAGPGSDVIPIGNFYYLDSSGTNTKTPFSSTTATNVHMGWAKAPQNPGYLTDSIDLYLTIPFGTAPGSYSTSITFQALAA